MQTPMKKMIILTQPNSCEKVIFLSGFSTSILMKKKTKIAIPETGFKSCVFLLGHS